MGRSDLGATLEGMKTTLTIRGRRWPLVVAGLLLEPVVMKLRGYPIGGRLVVRCRQGHLFTTIWLPSASLKVLRLGWWRVQRCPVGEHWTLVTPVKEADLSRAERRAARKAADIRIP